MADENVLPGPHWGVRTSHTAEDTLFTMESLQATLEQLEVDLRQQDISETSSTEYCNNFCQALMHYAGSRNSVEHGLPLLEVYCLSINCFAAARPHLAANSDSVALVLKRLALSCFELLLSVPENEIPFNAWMQFHCSVQAAHDTLMQHGNTDLQALLQITGEGGAWNNPVLVALLTSQPTDTEEVNTYIALEGEGFMEMRIKHLEKVGELEKALILTKACTNCSLIPNQASFRQTFVSQLCQLLPNEEAIIEISRLDGKDILDTICNMETEGDENMAFILCTTYLTQQLQQESLYCSWELTLLWSKLQRRIDQSIESFLERCLQLGAIAKTVYHLLFFIRVVQTEAMELGLGVSVELCVKAIRLPGNEDVDTKISVCKTVACLLPEDLEVLRACQLTEFLLEPALEAFKYLEELYKRPDQKYDEKNGIIPNSLRCELLLALKAHWPFDPEFWDWKTLKHHCSRLLGVEPDEVEEDYVPEGASALSTALNEEEHGTGENEVDGEKHEIIRSRHSSTDQDGRIKEETWLVREQKTSSKKNTFDTPEMNLNLKCVCLICQKEVTRAQVLHHSNKHVQNGIWTCPMCLQAFQSKTEYVSHHRTHIQVPSIGCPQKKKKVKKKVDLKKERDQDDLEPGEIALDPSLVMCYQSTHDPDVLEHILESASIPKKQNDDYITFDYISTHFQFQDREVYPCPATNCAKDFKCFKYLSVHLKAEHDDQDQNVKHYFDMRGRREKCTFCRRHFMTAYHNRKHRHVHYGQSPYLCIVTGCGARFDSISELVVHKQSHGFQLRYRCELKGCTLSFCDLGQLYHHEAQHFRDAAYTCASPGCRKFYYSRKEFTKHVTTHGIKCTEEDLEVQRKRKRKCLHPFLEENVHCGSTAFQDETTESLQNDVIQSSFLQADCNELGDMTTCVAVCFDGKKFICGFEKCGKTFVRARDIQRHLKMLHPGQFKAERKGHKKEKHSKAFKMLRNIQNKSKHGKTTQGSSHGKTPSPTTIPDQQSSAASLRCELNESLRDILLGLSKLSLHPSCFKNVPGEPSHPASGPKVPQVSIPPALNASSSTNTSPNKVESNAPLVVSDSKKPCQRTESPNSPTRNKGLTEDLSISNFHIQPTTKPYTCSAKGCCYQSVTSNALKRHYIAKHGFSKEEVKRLEIFISDTFKPFRCHLCPKSYKHKKELRFHYFQMHKISKTVLEQMKCSLKRRKEDKTTIASKPKMGLKQNSALLKKDGVKRKKKHFSTCQQKNLKRKDTQWSWPWRKQDSENVNKPKEKREGPTEPPALEQDQAKEDTNVTPVAREERACRRLVAKGNLCYVLTKHHKPFHCVHKDCSAAFSSQGSLVQHLESVHHYNRAQLSLEGDKDLAKTTTVRKVPIKTHRFPCKHKGCDKAFNHNSSLLRHYRKHHNSRTKFSSEASDNAKRKSATRTATPPPEEPIPRFKCTYANCNASYHLNSSLLRHTNQVHHDQISQKRSSPPVPCSFSQNGSNNKHVFYQHCNYNDSPVVHLQSAHRRERSDSGCQKKLIVTPCSRSLNEVPKLPLRQPAKHGNKSSNDNEDVGQIEETLDVEEETEECIKSSSSKRRENLVFRTHEEALQMCQDRCQPAAYPCMVQNCDSVVKHRSSLRRHYVVCHRMSVLQCTTGEDKLFYTVEQLEELIQKKSAISVDLARAPNGVLKMEYQAEPDNPGGPSLPMSLHSVKTDQEECQVGCKEEPPCNSNMLMGADDLLHGESNGHKEELHSEDLSQEDEPQSSTPPPVPSLPLDLSPPSTLRFTVDEGVSDSLGKDCCDETLDAPPTMSVSVLLTPIPSRQPLKWKNELSDSLPPPSPSPKDIQVPSPTRTFDLATYKPMGFESSFLKFIQEKEEEVFKPEATLVTQHHCHKSDTPHHRDFHRRNCSVKENQEGPTITRTRRTRSLPFKPLLSTGECDTVQNLRFILERALRGCGDQAIKQLQFLKPVVVLEKSKFSASLLDLLSSETKL